MRTGAGKTTKRAPLATKIPKSSKRSAGRTSAELTPAAIRTIGVYLDDETRRYIRERLGFKLGKFAENVERVSVRVEDMNGPKGGVDMVCRVKVTLSGMESVVVDVQDRTEIAAVDRAIDAAERGVRRTLGRVRSARTARRAA